LHSTRILPAETRRRLTGIVFVAPAMIFVAIFFTIPLVMMVWMSLHKWSLFGEHRWTGFANFATLFSDAAFGRSVLFTLKYTLLVTPAIFIVALVLTLLVEKRRSAVGIFRTAYFLPVVIGFGVSSLLWSWMYNSQLGVFDWLLVSLHIAKTPVQFFSSGKSALASVIFMVVWKTAGLNMILLLVGIQAIPGELHEAATVDGAGWWRRLRSITLPLMRRTFALALVLSVAGSMLAFDQFYIMTNGGPENTTITVVYEIYNSAFVHFRLGYASTLSIALLVILLVISVVQMYLLREHD